MCAPPPAESGGEGSWRESQSALCNCLMPCNDRWIIVIKAFIRIKICFETGSVNCLKPRGRRGILRTCRPHGKYLRGPLREFLTWRPGVTERWREGRESMEVAWSRCWVTPGRASPLSGPRFLFCKIKRSDHSASSWVLSNARSADVLIHLKSGSQLDV